MFAWHLSQFVLMENLLVFSKLSSSATWRPGLALSFFPHRGMFSRDHEEGEEEKEFRFHWRCKKVGLSHFCFADDLLIFCKGVPKVVNLIKDYLEIFSAQAGLHPNPDKSSVFLCNVPLEVKVEILIIPGYNECLFPFRYLGIPLISSRLKKEDCKGLIDQITARVQAWTSKYLSFAGRVQLIKSVLYSIQFFGHLS